MPRSRPLVLLRDSRVESGNGCQNGFGLDLSCVRENDVRGARLYLMGPCEFGTVQQQHRSLYSFVHGNDEAIGPICAVDRGEAKDGNRGVLAVCVHFTFPVGNGAFRFAAFAHGRLLRTSF